ncbi:MAG: OsmC family protein [Polyangiaceae bacterium]
MVDIHIAYEGELRCVAKHGPSGIELFTDAPVDNHGKGQSFSPTDLVATALGTCMMTVMGIYAAKHGIDLAGSRVHVKKVMTKAPPRRIAELPSEILVPREKAERIDEAARRALVEIAETCPVRLSLLPAIALPLVVQWGEQPQT